TTFKPNRTKANRHALYQAAVSLERTVNEERGAHRAFKEATDYMNLIHAAVGKRIKELVYEESEHNRAKELLKEHIQAILAALKTSNPAADFQDHDPPLWTAIRRAYHRFVESTVVRQTLQKAGLNIEHILPEARPEPEEVARWLCDVNALVKKL